jgi:hypothetical protein
MISFSPFLQRGAAPCNHGWVGGGAAVLDVLNLGVPLQFLGDGIGGPGNALSALSSSVVAFTGAVHAGSASAAGAALAEMPAVVTNGFLNGSTVITLPQASHTAHSRSTEFGGIIPGLLTFGPQLAAAITPTT